ncbi:hypothetical protein [Streptomyces sp. NBC_00996]|uniref:SbtR family transcriptional regulator n=1 Tax=Streptomyces sp. NBC_00996 TaxID=2903710 RepID=UPI003866E3CC
MRHGAVRNGVELPEVYALLVGAARAAAHACLNDEVRSRLLATVFAGLAPATSQTSTADFSCRAPRRATTVNRLRSGAAVLFDHEGGSDRTGCLLG